MNIGRYEVLQELGQGGMAMVYLALDPYMKRRVAVKVLPRQFTFDPQFRTRFQREAEVIATLEHAYIVPVHDFGEEDDQPFIVMRYMSGGTLADRLSTGPLPIPEIATLIEHIGSSVDYAHSLGIIHRDIKPGNILFDARGNPCLSDFGIAKIAEATAAFTGTGIIGTPAYMSPEQAQGEKNLDGRCDVYSLGVVLFQALTGDLPFKADTPMGVAVAHITEPVPSLLERRPDLPAAFETVIRKSLEKNPAKRYQTAGELAQALQQAAGGMETQPGNKTVLEPVAGTVIEPVAGTYVEPRSDPVPPSKVLPTQERVVSTAAPPPMDRKSALPKLMGVGGAAVLALCLCVGLIGGFASGLIPNPFASAPTETAALIPSETPALPQASATAAVTQFVPLGLSATYIEYILDASGSMLQTLQGKTRLQIAQEVLSARLSALPPNTQVGLRVYGHRVPYQGRESESCQDIELVVPIQANGAQSIIDWLPGMQALGMTPMSESIRQAANDFTFEPGRRNFIVLISDGEETCGEEPATVVEYLQEIGIDFAIHVIGLDVDAQTAAQLKRIADVAGGVYFDAKSEEDLDAALINVNESMLPAAGVPTIVAQASATAVPEPNAEIASEGTVQASSIYNADFPASLAVDGDPTTSWWSAGPEGNGTTTYIWTGVRDDFIAAIELISNRENEVVAFRTEYGFAEVTVQVLDARGTLVFEESANLDGTPDPDVHVFPNVVGRSIRLIFTGSEAPDCGGFGELKIGAVRSDTPQAASPQSGEPLLPYFTANTDMFCREGPSTSHADHWQLRKGETVPVLAQWHEDPSWLLVDINAPASETRTDCCWVGGQGTLNVPSDRIKTINFLPDRLDCSAVK
ncbi:MAG TPA: protein kinase [Anaerolineales bacterium]|nr:protein kinase [Anaerolineales bacterium]